MWRSPGAERGASRGAAALAVALTLAPALARADPGQEAFDRGDYAAAAELWRAEASQGSAEAAFGLGLILDLGLGVPRNPSAALRWYLEAADDGLADAQFNVAVMLDAGTGVPRDPGAAATWYARAAANGHPRAQYNLGLLYEGGIGVPRDDAMARLWFEAASSRLAAAADRLERLPPAGMLRTGGLPPRPVTGALVGPPARPRVELVWTGDARREGFRVEVARRPGGQGATPAEGDVLLSQEVGLTAVALDLPAGAGQLAWRVGRGGGSSGGMAWSPWQELSQASVGPPPPTTGATSQRLTIIVNPGDAPARDFARELSDAYAAGGVEVTVREAARPASATTVEYRHPDDAALAAAVAGFLPGLRSDSPVQTMDLDAAPGEVTLRLVGGPDLPDPLSGNAERDRGEAQPSRASQTSRVPGGGAGL